MRTIAIICKQLGFQSRIGRRLVRDYRVLVSLSILALLSLSILLGPVIYSQDPGTIDFAQSLLPPSLANPLGTNDLGQDQLARILWGGRVSLSVAFTAALVSTSVGTFVGVLSGFFGGWWDGILMRLTDLFLALPQLPLLLLLVYLFRDSLKRWVGPELGIFVLVVVAIGGLSWMSVARLVRGEVLKLRELEFVSAAIALGAHPIEILWRHILPNVLGLITVAATLAIGNAIIVESTLSFLGLGFPPDVPTWGRMLYDAQNFLTIAPYIALVPGGAIFLTVLSVNYLGEGLRDVFDPHTRSPNS